MSIFNSLFGPPVPHLDPASAQTKLSGNPKPYLLDVREPEEYKSGHIPGATLMPLGQLAGRKNELPRDREIICVCHSGNRSGSATRHLVASGFNASNLSGGMINWSRAGLPIKKGMSK